MIDRYGKAAYAMIAGPSVLLVDHFAFTFISINPHIPMVMLGVAISLAPVTMWPSMVKLVDDKLIVDSVLSALNIKCNLKEVNSPITLENNQLFHYLLFDDMPVK